MIKWNSIYIPYSIGCKNYFALFVFVAGTICAFTGIPPTRINQIHHIPADILIRRFALHRVNAEEGACLRGVPAGAEVEEVNVTPVPVDGVTITSIWVTISNIGQVSVVTNIG
jgi:hypothetical protein